MTLTTAEMVEILEEIARDGKNGAARIAAIKALREINAGERPSTGFEELDEFTERRQARAGAT